eukprot:scaffold2176_cov350-Prasinococcus_capsulatus_cf.AAC.5
MAVRRPEQGGRAPSALCRHTPRTTSTSTAAAHGGRARAVPQVKFHCDYIAHLTRPDVSGDSMGRAHGGGYHPATLHAPSMYVRHVDA